MLLGMVLTDVVAASCRYNAAKLPHFFELFKDAGKYLAAILLPHPCPVLLFCSTDSNVQRLDATSASTAC